MTTIKMGQRLNDRLTPALLTVIVTLIGATYLQQDENHALELEKMQQIGKIETSVGKMDQSISGIQATVDNITDDTKKFRKNLAKSLRKLQKNQLTLCLYEEPKWPEHSGCIR